MKTPKVVFDMDAEKKPAEPKQAAEAPHDETPRGLTIGDVLLNIEKDTARIENTSLGLTMEARRIREELDRIRELLTTL